MGFVKDNDRVVFNVRRYNSDLWASDGTPAGTQPLGVRGGMNLTSAGDFAVFHDENTDGDGLRNEYVTDGTAAGTRTGASLHLPDFSRPGGRVGDGESRLPGDEELSVRQRVDGAEAVGEAGDVVLRPAVDPERRVASRGGH